METPHAEEMGESQKENEILLVETETSQIVVNSLDEIHLENDMNSAGCSIFRHGEI